MKFRKLMLSVVFSALITWPATSIYFLYSLMVAAGSGQPTTDLAAQALQGALVCWIVFTVIIYQIQSLFEDLNKAQRKDFEERQKKQNPPDGPNNDRS